MKEIVEKLADYGADIKGVLERFVNDEDLYIECMQEFLCDESFEI